MKSKKLSVEEVACIRENDGEMAAAGKAGKFKLKACSLSQNDDCVSGMLVYSASMKV